MNSTLLVFSCKQTFKVSTHVDTCITHSHAHKNKDHMSQCAHKHTHTRKNAHSHTQHISHAHRHGTTYKKYMYKSTHTYISERTHTQSRIHMHTHAHKNIKTKYTYDCLARNMQIYKSSSSWPYAGGYAGLVGVSVMKPTAHGVKATHTTLQNLIYNHK